MVLEVSYIDRTDVESILFTNNPSRSSLLFSENSIDECEFDDFTEDLVTVIQNKTVPPGTNATIPDDWREIGNTGVIVCQTTPPPGSLYGIIADGECDLTSSNQATAVPPMNAFIYENTSGVEKKICHQWKPDKGFKKPKGAKPFNFTETTAEWTNRKTFWKNHYASYKQTISLPPSTKVEICQFRYGASGDPYTGSYLLTSYGGQTPSVATNGKGMKPFSISDAIEYCNNSSLNFVMGGSGCGIPKKRGMIPFSSLNFTNSSLVSIGVAVTGRGKPFKMPLLSRRIQED